MAYDLETAWRKMCQVQRDLAKLQLYHLFDRLRAGEVPAECNPSPPPGRGLFEFAAAAWTTFHSYYFRDPGVPGHHKEPAWLAFAERLEKIFVDGADAPLDVLTERAYPLLLPEIEKREVRQRPQFFRPRPFGCFSYDYREPQGYVALHFSNVYAPDSPFADMRRLFASLQDIVEDITAKGCVVERIGCDSWVDNLPPFKACFPPSFAASMTPTNPDAKTGFGWWGQFIDRTLSLHQQRARLLRESRQFKYHRMHAECPYEEFVQHVQAQLATA